MLVPFPVLVPLLEVVPVVEELPESVVEPLLLEDPLSEVFEVPDTVVLWVVASRDP